MLTCTASEAEEKLLKSQNSNLVIFLGVGAFEQLFGPVRGNVNKNFPKLQMPGGGLPGVDLEALI